MINPVKFIVFYVIFQCVLSDENIPSELKLNQNKTISYRLPNDTIPISYNVSLITDIHRGLFNFSGTAIIRLKVKNNTNEIVLHSKYLNNFKLNLFDADTGKEFHYLNYTTDDNGTEFLRIFSSEEPLNLISEHVYVLIISYESILGERVNGFYRNSYINSYNETIWIAVTQFEPTYARYAIPCYDEPQFKARFTVTVTHGNNYTALSNMPESSIVKQDNGMTTTSFEETPIMSPYLMAIVVANYNSVVTDHQNKTHRVFTPPDLTFNSSFALDTSIKIVDKLEEYFEIPYVLPKIDHVAVPDHYALAMENWGLIIYREKILNLNRSTETDKYYNMIDIVTHEFVHQWFGNLVTPKWWTWIWLSEGFATFYSHKISNKIFSDWNTEDYFMTEYIEVMNFYSWNTDPITNYSEDPIGIRKLFGFSTYYKASNIIRMFENAVGEKTFKKGVKKYLNRFQFSNVDEDNLFECLQEAINEDKIKFFSEIPNSVSRALKTWTSYNGTYPVITVTRNYEDGTITIKQVEYIGHTLDRNVTLENYTWWIPINFVVASNPNFQITTLDYLLTEKEVTLENVSADANEWIILNKQQTGYYRINYDERNWKMIIKTLMEDHNKIHKYNRAHLINDAFKMMFKNELNLDIWLDLISYLPNERDLYVWLTIDKVLHKWFVGTARAIPLFETFLQNNIRPIFNEIGFVHRKDDLPFVKVARSRIITLSCRLGLKECLDLSRSAIFAHWKNGTALDAAIKFDSVFCFGMKNATDEEFDYAFEQMLAANESEKFNMYLEGLSCSNKHEHIKKLINVAIDFDPKETDEMKERLKILTAFESPSGVNVTIDFLKDIVMDPKVNIPFDFEANDVEVSETDTEEEPPAHLKGIVIYLSERVFTLEQSEQLMELIEMTKNRINFTENDLENVSINLDEGLANLREIGTNLTKWLDIYYFPNETNSSKILFKTNILICILSSIPFLFNKIFIF